MAFNVPPENKSAVRRAGRAISSGRANEEDFALVERWRSAHAYIINTFQAWLKRHIAKQPFEIEFAQRLKRRNTVLGKLKRTDPEGKPLISDVASMHDFAGCRMIFDNLDQLSEFRAYLHSSAVMRNVDHVLRHVDDPEKYNYISRPKFTGYRGIHDVYRHFPRGTNRAEERKPWDGLLVEIQYRTRAQHAWATAVEISDLLDNEQTKFELDQSHRGRFFTLASEIFARNVEGIANAFDGIGTDELRSEIQGLEKSLGILRRLKLLKQFEDEEKIQRHTVLNVFKSETGQLKLDVIPFSTPSDAIEHASLLEGSESSLNAVYVRSDNPKQLRSAYRNYFNDPLDFVEMIEAEGGI